jgi:hypothetical protein
MTVAEVVGGQGLTALDAEALQHKRYLALIGLWKTIVYGLSAILIVLASYPTAHVFAGRDTGINVNITIAISIAVTAAWLLTAKKAHTQGKQIASLTGANIEIGAMLRREKERCTALERDLDRLRDTGNRPRVRGSGKKVDA